MSKHRVCTTISAKHWKLLRKYTEKFETQQKVLELALENLEDNSNQCSALSQEEQLWIRAGREMKTACIVHRDVLKALLETIDFERVKELIADQSLEYQIISYYQKPLKNCTLKEIMDGLVIIARTAKLVDTVNYADEGDHYTFKMIQDLGINCSKIFKIGAENLFRAYGVKTEIELSENSVFMKVYKNL